MLVFSREISPRLEYACRLVLEPVYKNWRCTREVEEFMQADGPKICYAPEDISAGKALHIVPAGILFETDIRSQSPEVGMWNARITLFHRGKGTIPFDMLAAAFFLAVRYEEYLEFEPDGFGRFEAEASIAHRHNFLECPLIDHWRHALRTIHSERWPADPVQTGQFSVLSTIDVDSAFAYRFKGPWRTTLGVFKDLAGFGFGRMLRRLSYVWGAKKDPYDTYEEIGQIHQESGIDLICFFLLADFGKYDKGVSFKSSKLREVILKMSRHAAVGIHPGVASGDHAGALTMEIERLAQITGDPVRFSRQHYLRLSFPATYRQLIANGITDDFTMGYATKPGFRASTSQPFPWYDLQAEKETTLMVHPFAVMDSTLNHYLKMSPQEAITRIQVMVKEVREARGTFVSLWHNESLSECDHWLHWKKVFTAMIRVMAEKPGIA